MSTAISPNAMHALLDARAVSERDHAIEQGDGAQGGSLGRGLLFALPISGMLWVGIIAAFRAVL